MTVATQFPSAYDFTRDSRLRTMFEGAAIGMAICRLDGRILDANAALCCVLGYTLPELTGPYAHVLFPESHTEIHDGPLDNFPPGELLFGQLMREERCGVEFEKIFHRRSAPDLCGHLRVTLARDEHRQPQFLIVSLSDATESSRFEEYLRAAEKMQTIGRLASGVAHDFNNLLSGILMYCDLLSAGLIDGLTDVSSAEQSIFDISIENAPAQTNESQTREALLQHVEEVRKAVEQGAGLTRQLLATARKQTPNPQPVRINEVVISTTNLLRRLIGEQISLVVELDPSLDAELAAAGLAANDHSRLRRNGQAVIVMADQAQLGQVLMNLVLNARDALPEGGEIRVTTRAASFPGTEAHAVVLAVKDNGCGMNAETRAHLFEVFFTTKDPGAGTGLGLATVQRIVNEARGTIVVESAPGCGTCVEVFLPALTG